MRDDMARALYVAWCAENTIGTAEQASVRWSSLNKCLQREFYGLADAALVVTCGHSSTGPDQFGRCMSCAHEAAEDAELRL